MFENHRIFETTIAGRPFKVEVGKMCELSNGSALISYGETSVLCNVTASGKPRDGIDFFPLSVDFEEKLYAVGRIPGSFIRRESRPTENAILASRVVDRPMRPLFPKDMRNDVTIVMTVMSVDPDCSQVIAGMIGASIVTAISDIPFNGPIGGVSIGLCDGEIVINPTAKERETSQMEVTLAATREKIVMIEAQANEVDDDTMLAAIEKGHEEIKKIIDFIDGIVSEIGKEKFTFTSMEVDAELYNAIKEFAIDKVKHALDTDDKNVRDARMAPITDEINEKFQNAEGDNKGAIGECIYKLQKYIVRRWLLDEGKRVDGRGIDDIRPLDAQVSLIPRVHGSGMFTRGQTQVLTITTLGQIKDSQLLDGLDDEDTKRYMHHYNFPSYSVGETRPSRGPGRREIGHGALAEKALLPVIPSVEEFPYSLRLVSEVLSSNGSTSQASICGSTLSLMDAGVPIKAPVAGISCGLVTEDDRFITMVDIQGVEDFYGDMDFKVGGTKSGITAIQVDIKVDGLSMEVIKEAFVKCKKGRLHILDDIMLPVIAAPREELSKYAPKMLQIKIPVDKIKDVIGKGGAVIQKICADCDVKIDINDEGQVFVSAIDIDNARKAVAIIETIAMDPEVGAIYKGVVTRLMNFGAFVEIAPGKEGLCHISKLDNERVGKVEDVVAVGDLVVVKVIKIDEQGRIDLSRKDAIAEIEAKKNAQNTAE